MDKVKKLTKNAKKYEGVIDTVKDVVEKQAKKSKKSKDSKKK